MMYNKFIVKIPFKATFEDIFSNTKETRSFLAGQEIEGRIDNVRGKSYFVTSDGAGSIINIDYIERIS